MQSSPSALIHYQGMNLWVEDSCRGIGLRTFVVDFLVPASLRAQSELVDVCNKQDFDKPDVTMILIATSFAWRPHAIAYRSPDLESSLRRCLGSMRSCLDRNVVPLGSWLQRAKRFITCKTKLHMILFLDNLPQSIKIRTNVTKNQTSHDIFA